MDINTILQPFQRFGVHLGLERITQLLANLGNPHHQVPVIHVAGTNGKGSVCAYLSSVLTAAGYRVGRYTSPHLVDWTERITLNEEPISSNKLCELLQQVQAAVDPEQESPTQFEVITAAAWLYFCQEKVDVGVIEVGLGGRLDATNVCPQPLITIITSLSREHWQQLGPTLADIAREKAGILKSGCPTVVGPLPPEAQKVVKQRILELNCPFVFPQPALEIEPGWAVLSGETQNSQQPTPFTLYPCRYPLALPGQIQLTNSAIAICAIQILQQQGWQISPSAIINGMANTRWLGRMQWTTWQNHKLLVDGAHNPAAAQVLRQYVDSLNTSSSVTWVMGMLSTKDHAEIFTALLRPSDRLYLVPVPDHSSAEPTVLATLADEICPELSECQTYPDLESGLATAFAATDGLVVLCGSLYLVGHFLGRQKNYEL